MREIPSVVRVSGDLTAARGVPATTRKTKPGADVPEQLSDAQVRSGIRNVISVGICIRIELCTFVM